MLMELVYIAPQCHFSAQHTGRFFEKSLYTSVCLFHPAHLIVCLRLRSDDGTTPAELAGRFGTCCSGFTCDGPPPRSFVLFPLLLLPRLVSETDLLLPSAIGAAELA